MELPRRLERLARIPDEIDVAGVVAFRVSVAADRGNEPWVVIAESRGDLLARDRAAACIDRAIHATVPGVVVRIVLVPPGRLPRNEGGQVDVERVQRDWQRRRQSLLDRAVEPKPADLDGEADLDPHAVPGEDGDRDVRGVVGRRARPLRGGGPEAGSESMPDGNPNVSGSDRGSRVGIGHPEAVTLIRSILAERHPDRPALGSLDVTARLVAPGCLTPIEVLAISDDLGWRIGRRIVLPTLQAIGGATIADLARRVVAASAQDRGGDGDVPKHAAGESAHPGPVPRAARGRSSLVAGRVDGPFADPAAGGAETPTARPVPAPAAGDPRDDSVVGDDIPLEPRAAGGGDSDRAGRGVRTGRGPTAARRLMRRLRESGARIGVGVHVAGPISVQIDPTGRLEIDAGVTLMPGVTIRVEAGASLRLHAGVWIGAGSTLIVVRGRTAVGADTVMGPGVMAHATGDLLIGRECIVGAGALIEAGLLGVGHAPAGSGRGIVVLDAGTIVPGGAHVLPGTCIRRAG